MSKAFVMAMAERLRQVNGEGFDAAHDDAYAPGTLAAAGECYARAAYWTLTTDNQLPPPPMIWPWHAAWWKPSADPKRNIEKAMALLAAEYDRLERAEGEPPNGPLVPDLAYSTNEDDWKGEDIQQFSIDHELIIGDVIYEGDVVRHKGSDFSKNVVDRCVIEHMREQAWEEADEHSASYLDNPTDGADDILQAFVDAWADTYAQPDFYRVANVRERTITEEDLSL